MAVPRTPSFGLAGKRALVTGAGRGIGFAVASAFAQAGAHVTLCARTGTEIEAGAAALRSEGWSADHLEADVVDVAMFRQGLEHRETYDILFNNAGTNRPKPFVDVSTEDFDAVVGLNVKGAFFTAQSFAATLLQEGRPGSIINVSSQMGHVGAANRSLYCASKWAMEGFSKAMAIELGPRGIRVNTLCPTFIETPLTAPFLEDHEFRIEVLSKIRIGRLGTVEDLMGAAVFLASDASSLMTGSSLLVDGGWTAG